MTSPKSDTVLPPTMGNGLMGIPETCLYSGAKFKGMKRWRDKRYEMEVDLKHYDALNEKIYGIMTLKNEVPEYSPLKVTYFEGEIVGREKHSYHTRKWYADSDVDREYWWKFENFPKFTKFVSPSDYKSFNNLKDCKGEVYMRWKEVPAKDNVGYVAPGFYYVCLKNSDRTIEGMYYEVNCESDVDGFSLKHVTERSFPVYEFR